ncbi:MAG: GtrA family protein [Thermacetogeniaceae bacterium]
MVRFVIVGCINTGIDFLVFSALHIFFGFDQYSCQVAGYSAGIINSFVMNKLWTFDRPKSNLNTAVQFIEFVGVNLVSLGVSLVGLNLLGAQANLNIYLSKMIVTVFVQLLNYTAYKQVVFQQ